MKMLGPSAGNNITGDAVRSTVTTLLVHFWKLGVSNIGALGAQVTVSSTWSHSSMVTVANVVPDKPRVTNTTSVLSTDTTKLTIKGIGFETVDSFIDLDFFTADNECEQALVWVPQFTDLCTLGAQPLTLLLVRRPCVVDRGRIQGRPDQSPSRDWASDG